MKRQPDDDSTRKVVAAAVVTAAVTAMFSILATLAVAFLVTPRDVGDDVQANTARIEQLRGAVQTIDKRTVRIETLLEQLNGGPTHGRAND